MEKEVKKLVRTHKSLITDIAMIREGVLTRGKSPLGEETREEEVETYRKRFLGKDNLIKKAFNSVQDLAEGWEKTICLKLLLKAKTEAQTIFKEIAEELGGDK